MSQLDLAGKVVVFTGAAGLIGSECCISILRSGAKLVALDSNSSNLSRLEEVLKRSEIQIEGRTLFKSDVDLSSPDSIQKCISSCIETFGKIDCLINCHYPRTTDWGSFFENIEFESYRKNIDMHLNSYFLTSQKFGSFMAKQGFGNIINFSSIYGLVGPDFTVYSGTENMTSPAGYSIIKGGISNFTKYLAAYLGPHGVRANAICPGGVADSQNPKFVNSYESKVPLRRMAQTQDIVGPLLFLISDLSAYVTGINLPVDGGWTAI